MKKAVKVKWKNVWTLVYKYYNWYALNIVIFATFHFVDIKQFSFLGRKIILSV